MNIYRPGGEFGEEFGQEKITPPQEELGGLGDRIEKSPTIEEWKRKGLLQKAAAIAGAAREVITEAAGITPEKGEVGSKRPEVTKPKSEIERKPEHPEFG